MTSLRSNTFFSLVLATSLGAVACGGDEAPPVDDDNADDTATLSSCEKFDDPSGRISAYPAVYDGSLALESSSLVVAPGSCDVEIAPFGVDTPGPDSVVALQDLTPGRDYVVRMYSESDLALYIATGCDEELRGPATDSCLLFSDETVQPPERGMFTAPASGEVTLVVDYFLAATPVDGGYSLDVYEAECSSNDECGGDAPFCMDSRCVACETSYDCSSPDTPICDSRSGACVAGDNLCASDDANEGPDDGPAGATDVTPGDSDVASVTGSICNDPAAEVDFFKFEVETSGSSYLVELAWENDGADLDWGVFDATGRQLGASLWRQPEVIELTYLKAGTYYASVNLFGSASAVGQEYTVTVTKLSDVGCETATDCAASFDTQLYRGTCDVDGACVSIDGGGALELEDSCDSADDCASGSCSSFSFTADADQRAVCTGGCSTDSECDGYGDAAGDFICTTYLLSNVCVPKCETDDQCAVLIGSRPTCAPDDISCNINPPTWTHLSCNVGSGKCEFPQ